MKVSKSSLRRNASCIAFCGCVWCFALRCRCFLVTLLHLVVAFQHKLRIILMTFLVMCVFSWVFLAALIMY
jgi:hypothetical protein